MNSKNLTSEVAEKKMSIPIMNRSCEKQYEKDIDLKLISFCFSTKISGLHVKICIVDTDKRTDVWSRDFII